MGKVQVTVRQLSDDGSSNTPNGAGSSSDNVDNFFSAVMKQSCEKRNRMSERIKAETIATTWLQSKSRDSLNDSAFSDEYVMMKLFMKFNTSLLSNAAVGILRAKRSWLGQKLAFL